jgi:hypothetical protein
MPYFDFIRELTKDGRVIAVVYDQIDECTVYPITAFEVED